MNRDQALTIVKKQLGEGPRYQHTLRVTECAIKLAEKYGADIEQTELAAIFHDYAKLMPIDELKRRIELTNEDSRLLVYPPELWHGPVAARIICEQFGIANPDVIAAIRYHTTGRAGMSLLEKVIYLADYIEPGRSFPGIEETRELAEISLDQAVLKALSNTILFLLKKNASIFPDTFEAYNSLIIKGGKRF
ncbi:bis(5'-nucleosyl)-tetraphosphatase (symmetrical) YqeK [Bacillus niameyensis]|uniref:bis(5'-nucleosyl)-tetraphosphatase (symmetrical) YqeK n=1 Tax=Bacillus niameyensis TaxID=1522308 RepID=UPI000783A318|nr:bis(5'-nucleosyl)-tetraphosphatase (symmetrical) YqeK [Bacillus niameyensis]